MALVSFEAINLREDPVDREVVGNRVHRLAHDRGSHLSERKSWPQVGWLTMVESCNSCLLAVLFQKDVSEMSCYNRKKTLLQELQSKSSSMYVRSAPGGWGR